MKLPSADSCDFPLQLEKSAWNAVFLFVFLWFYYLFVHRWGRGSRAGDISDTWHCFRGGDDIPSRARKRWKKNQQSIGWHRRCCHIFCFFFFVFFFVCVCLFLVACPICQQELRVSTKFHTFNKRHVKHETPTFLEGSEILSVVKLKAPVAPGTCIMRVPATPAGLWIPSGPIMLVCLLLLTTSSL